MVYLVRTGEQDVRALHSTCTHLVPDDQLLAVTLRVTRQDGYSQVVDRTESRAAARSHAGSRRVKLGVRVVAPSTNASVAPIVAWIATIARTTKLRRPIEPGVGCVSVILIPKKRRGHAGARRENARD